MEPTKRFTGRVANYAKYRPSYPEAILDLLEKEIVFDSQKDIADIGSGTGKLAKLFLNNENLVFGVEPNEEMRDAAEKILKDYINFISVNGTAEFTALADRSVDLITSGQAFHWFDSEKAKAEFSRIIKPGGYVVLIWNVRDTEASVFMKEYEMLLKEFSTDPAVKEIVSETELNKFYGVRNFREANFRNTQALDFTGLKGRLFSASYIPEEGEATKEILIRLKDIFTKHNKDGRVKLLYDTKVYFGKIK